jgi:hypothetical protein
MILCKQEHHTMTTLKPKRIIVDDFRLYDLGQFDTPAETPEDAKAKAEELCRQTGLPCHVLAVVATVRPGLNLEWDGAP